MPKSFPLSLFPKLNHQTSPKLPSSSHLHLPPHTPPQPPVRATFARPAAKPHASTQDLASTQARASTPPRETAPKVPTAAPRDAFATLICTSAAAKGAMGMPELDAAPSAMCAF